jgi:hypothetical protein
VSDFYSSEDKNEAKGTISPPALALSNDAIYSAVLSSGITVHGYPPDTIIEFIRNLPILPFPSL